MNEVFPPNFIYLCKVTKYGKVAEPAFGMGGVFKEISYSVGVTN